VATKGERTRAALLDVALKMFRRRGFDETSMRDIAEAAGMSLGASYYYFRSKEEIVFAYYEDVQREHEQRLPEAWPASVPLAERLRTLFSTKLDIVARDRKFLAALFRYAAEPGHPLGVFSEGTMGVRDRAVRGYERALADLVPGELTAPVAQALWVAHLGLLLHLLHDGSAHGEKTRKLADIVADAAGRAVPLLSSPLLRDQAKELIAKLASI
jgi:AcrR family transcriptional regulator